MLGRQLVVAVLDQMQVLDQQVTLARRISQQGLDLVQSLGVDVASLGRRLGAAASRAGVIEPADGAARRLGHAISTPRPGRGSSRGIMYSRCPWGKTGPCPCARFARPPQIRARALTSGSVSTFPAS